MNNKIKIFLAKLCCKILIKLKTSVIINARVVGGFYQYERTGLLYNCDFSEGNLIDSFGNSFSIPTCKRFHVEYDGRNFK